MRLRTRKDAVQLSSVASMFISGLAGVDAFEKLTRDQLAELARLTRVVGETLRADGQKIVEFTRLAEERGAPSDVGGEDMGRFLTRRERTEFDQLLDAAYDATEASMALESWSRSHGVEAAVAKATGGTRLLQVSMEDLTDTRAMIRRLRRARRSSTHD